MEFLGNGGGKRIEGKRKTGSWYAISRKKEADGNVLP
jgi:hypothetical protein